MGWTFVQHVHTKHSFDSMADPVAVARRAEAVGIEVLAVTDHDTWQGAIDVRTAAVAEGLEVRVIIGSEVNTKQGDVIGLFLKENVGERNAPKFCDIVHEQGGLVVLPHPYKWHHLDEPLLARVDLIESYNARCSREENARAEELARERGLPMVVGADAHRVAEILRARTEFEGTLPESDEELKKTLLHGERRFYTNSPSIWDEWWTQSFQFMKRPNPKLAWELANGAFARIIKPHDYMNR
jgi:predicted metal-dependent phosphoesterase TrpH